MKAKPCGRWPAKKQKAQLHSVIPNPKAKLLDQTLVLPGFYAQRAYPEALRRIGYRDPQTGKALSF